MGGYRLIKSKQRCCAGVQAVRQWLNHGWDEFSSGQIGPNKKIEPRSTERGRQLRKCIEGGAVAPAQLGSMQPYILAASGKVENIASGKIQGVRPFILTTLQPYTFNLITALTYSADTAEG